MMSNKSSFLVTGMDIYRVSVQIKRIFKGSSLESMANAVENSYVFLMCVSENYRQSVNCQAEAQVPIFIFYSFRFILVL